MITMFNGNSQSEVEEIFSEAWQKVQAGHSIESAVSAYPEYSSEIEPMLRLTAAVRDVPQPALSAGALAQIRERTQEAAHERNGVAALVPNSIIYKPYIAYAPPRRSLRSWLGSFFPTVPTLRGSAGVLVMLVMLVGTMAIIETLSRQADLHQPLETYSGTITSMTATAWWIGDEKILIDNTTKIYGQPKVGAEMVCVGRPLSGDRMKALEVWIRLAPDGSSIIPKTLIPLPTKNTEANASVFFVRLTYHVLLTGQILTVSDHEFDFVRVTAS